MKTRISGKEAVQVAEDMAKPGPIRVVAASEAQEAPGALVPSPGSELDRKAPPRVRKPLPRNDQWKAPTPDLEGHRERLREALGNTLSDEFVDVILGKLVEALRPRTYAVLLDALNRYRGAVGLRKRIRCSHFDRPLLGLLQSCITTPICLCR